MVTDTVGMTESASLKAAERSIAATAPVPGVQAALKPREPQCREGRVSDPTDDGLWPMARWERDRDDPLTMDVIAERVSDGERLRDVCRSRGWPKSRVAQWIEGDAARKSRYEASLKLWADELAQECVGIAKDATPDDVSTAKLRVDTHLKLAARWDRERYGERSTVDVNQRVTVDIGARLVAAQERLARERSRVIDAPVDVPAIEAAT